MFDSLRDAAPLNDEARLYDEAVPDRVLGDRARLDEMEQVVGTSRLGAGAGQAVATEWLPSDDQTWIEDLQGSALPLTTI